MKKISFYKVFNILPLFIIAVSCTLDAVRKENNSMPIKPQIQDNLVIAHRGTTFYAPEETEAAMRWARNTGAHYLELDLQRSSDGYLLALHDDNLQRTSNIASVFPDRINSPVSEFTYQELLKLDAGSWFNSANPDRAKEGFKGLQILTLEDVIKIAEGYKIVKNEAGKKKTITDKNGRISSVYEKDIADNGNRPGVYIETKVPELFPGIENDLKKELQRLGWYNDEGSGLKTVETFNGKITIAGSASRVILQTFSRQSLKKLNQVFADYVPICFLLWRGDSPGEINDDRISTFREWIEFGKENGASIVGPSISGPPNDYPDLLTPQHKEVIKAYGMKIHAYSFDTETQMNTYGLMVNGMFTNKADETIFYYKARSGDKSNSSLITPESLGY
jgi:glycerophosphoryl diester phosphodiesterase